MPEAQAVRLRGRILSVGFPSSDSSAESSGLSHFRPGRWTPVKVELTNDDGDLFSGRIEVRQPDHDGDPVVARQEISLRDSRTYFLYVPAARSVRDHPFHVHVFSADGLVVPLFDDRNKPVKYFEAPTLEVIRGDSHVILDISEGGLNHLDSLTRNTRDAWDSQHVTVARIAPNELPDLVAGLDMVDTIVWDAADPTVIDLPHREALLNWTRRGGTLALGVSKNYDIINRSVFGGLLPVRLPEHTTTRSPSDLPDDARSLLFGDSSTNTIFKAPLKYCPLSRKDLLPGSYAIIPVEKDPFSTGLESDGNSRILVAARPYGRGRVLVVAAEMRELFKVASADAKDEHSYSAAFLRQALLVRSTAQTRDSSGQGQQIMMSDAPHDINLHERIEQATSFNVTGALYFLFAFLFVVAYVLLATIGSWTWLKKRSLIRHAWPVFAALGVAASATSLMAVRVVRGVGNSVESFAVVDGRAGSSEACATCYLGLKTAAYNHLDLSLPDDWLDAENLQPSPAALRPRLSQGGMFSESTYAATAEYLAVPIAGQLNDVLFRATAKQFEGRWKGSMAGRLEAGLSRTRQSWPDLTDQSWIENQIGTDLDHCYLFVADRGFDAKRARYYNILCYHIPLLPNGKRVSIGTVLAAMNRDPQKPLPQSPAAILEEPAGGEQARDTRQRRTLGTLGEEWARNFGVRDPYGRYGATEERRIKVSSDEFTSAALILSLYDEFNPTVQAFMKRVDRAEGQHFDCSRMITRDTALFVGFGNDPGPARLCWRKSGSDTRWKPIEPDSTRTMYRIMIPVAVTAQ